MYSAKGGQIAPKEEGRNARVRRVYERQRLDSLQDTHQPHEASRRGDGCRVEGGRRISLTRTFDLDIRTPRMFVTAEPPLLKLEAWRVR